jgi:hypothetical protein
MFDNVIIEAKKHDFLKFKIFSDSLSLLDEFITHHTELVILDLDLLKNKISKFINTLKTIKKKRSDYLDSIKGQNANMFKGVILRRTYLLFKTNFSSQPE